MGAVRRYCLYGLPLAVVVFVTIGALTMSLFLFLNSLPLLPVNGIASADMLVSAGLDHTSQSPEQSKYSRCGLPVDMILHLFQQHGSIFIAMAGR